MRRFGYASVQHSPRGMCHFLNVEHRRFHCHFIRHSTDKPYNHLERTTVDSATAEVVLASQIICEKVALVTYMPSLPAVSSLHLVKTKILSKLHMLVCSSLQKRNLFHTSWTKQSNTAQLVGRQRLQLMLYKILKSMLD